MIRDGHIGAKFFTGIEVENTPALGENTLFVVGLQPITEIQDWLDDFNSREDKSKHIRHIYFGANMSFPVRLSVNDAAQWQPWENTVAHFLHLDYQCTLDIDVSCVEGLLEGPLCEFSNFIPMISVKLPYLRQLGYNATLKLDDKDFSATNPGVWCHSLHSLQNRRAFTPWSKYSEDKTI